MYLQNTSDTVVVMINTVVGRFGLKPHEVIHLEQKLLPPISEYIKKITEEEYHTFRGEPEQVEEQIEEPKQSTQTMGDESHQEDSVEEEIVEDITKTLQDTNASNFIKQLLNFSEPPQVQTPEPPSIDFESKGDTPSTDALIIKETNSGNEIEEMEKQLEELKKAWVATKTPKKKDKISKQIKEIQKQIDKLKKDTDK